MIRSPIVVTLGHVDVGKTALLDKIRGTAVMLKEPGAMTQHIGASFLPWSSLEKICSKLVQRLKAEVKIPGLLMIDTPGHAVFVNLRRRGGSIADFAILVIDILDGFEQQTYESLEILRSRKVPFVVAANKVDRIPGWKPNPGASIVESILKQDDEVVARLEELLYRIIADFRKLGFQADRYDRVKDFSRTVAIVPTSAVTGEGIPDLLLVLVGLVQRFYMKRLKVTPGPAKGVVLETREERGLGTCLDTIIYDGVLRRGDTIVVAGINGPIVTKVRAILLPKPMDEMRSPEDRFKQVEEVVAAAGVRVLASGVEEALAGSPLLAVRSEKEVVSCKKAVQEEVQMLRIHREEKGVVLKTDTLGSLEAILDFLKSKGIPVRLADIGPVSKRDVVEADIVRNEDPYLGVILAFNVKVLPDAQAEIESRKIPLFRNVIVYRLLEDYLKWVDEMRQKEVQALLSQLHSPAVIKILPGCVFRRSDPAIVGVEVLKGWIKGGIPLMKENGKRVGEVMQIQDRGKAIPEAKKGMAVAISIRGNVMVGRHIEEGEVLYTDLPESHYKLFKAKLYHVLSEDSKEALEEIAKIKRKDNPFWGV